MRVSEELRNEHEGVLVALNILEKICTKMTECLPTQHIEQLLEFLRIFVDKCHHGKEEDLLFPALETVGVARNGGPIGVMFAEHQKGRGFVKSMGEALDKAKAGDGKAVNEVVKNSVEYIKLLRQHIDKENAVLFVMADAKIPEAKQAELLKGFEEIEEKRVGHGKHEEFHKMLHTLREVYLK